MKGQTDEQLELDFNTNDLWFAQVIAQPLHNNICFLRTGVKD